MLTPLVIGDALRALGVPGSLAVLAVAILALWHARSIIQLLGQLGFAMKVVGLVGLVGVAAVVGVIPGVSIDVAAGQLGGFLAGVWEIVTTGVDSALDAVEVSL